MKFSEFCFFRLQFPPQFLISISCMSQMLRHETFWTQSDTITDIKIALTTILPTLVWLQTANKEQEKVTPKIMRTSQNQKLLNIYSKITFSTSREILRNKLYLIFIDEYSLNIDNIKSFGIIGLCWPSLAFVALDNFVKQQLAFFGKH